MSWPFELWSAPEGFDADEYAEMLGELRGLLAAVADAAPDPAHVRKLTADLRALRGELAACATDDDHAPFGQQHNIDGDHGLASVPQVRVLRSADGSLDGEVTFTRWHVGGGGTVHGGMVGVALDELMGRSQIALGWIARTAYLTVSYRAGTPWGRTLSVQVRTTRSEGRKQFLEARLFDGDQLFAEAEALFVRVSPYPASPALAGRPTLEVR
ncbi:acyl-coenzyme A thioesterase PaaI-like protein [Nocardioides sp. J9]|uniref:hotdog domain-containing protein n=1 Tax=Nocardioides sp. J9 TaxID=935844 RepID=UPI0011A7B953|nr:hotdog domain-containing protein [Nocardioides sp. J9]TWG91689.1 acyl-coenzyme A thioesterase PaaI-like protein [Nocardioides sp. J9]